MRKMKKSDSGTYNLPVRYGPEMRVLIVGGGISGLTLAGLLQQRGFRPTVAERAPEYGSVGYIIVLWPSGSRILKGLGLYRKLLDTGLPFSTYNVWNEKGEMLRSYSVEAVTEKYGPMISIYRPELINILREAVAPESIRMNTTVEKIRQTRTRCSSRSATAGRSHMTSSSVVTVCARRRAAWFSVMSRSLTAA